MGQEIFGIDIAALVADNIGPGVLEAVITRTPDTAERTAGKLTGGMVKAQPQEWTCRGFWEDFAGMPPPGVEIELNDRRAVLIGDTIPAEALPLLKNDAITCDGQTLYLVKVLSRDPAGAVLKCLCRDRRGPDGK